MSKNLASALTVFQKFQEMEITFKKEIDDLKNIYMEEIMR